MLWHRFTGWLAVLGMSLVFGFGCGNDDWKPPPLGPSGNLYLVAPDGSGDFPTIQAAIDSAVNGDIIELADGVFVGDGNRDLDFKGKIIIVRSESGVADSCIIDCQGTEQEPHRGFNFFSGEPAESILEGVSITNGYAENGGGIRVFGSSPTLAKVIFAENNAETGGGIYFAFANPTLGAVAFLENSATSKGGAVACVQQSSPSVSGATFYANSAPEGGGVYCSQSSSPTFVQSIIAFGTLGEAVFCNDDLGTCEPTLTCCDIYANAAGDWIGCIADQFGDQGNIRQDPRFCSRTNGDFHLQDDSPCADPEGCALMGAWPVACE